jgi:hypothetical protein
MKILKVLILIFIIQLVLTSLATAGETLYNGIVLPDQWPPKNIELKREPMPVPYLKNPPMVIPIDVGRQLFVDDFLIEKTMLQRTFHQPEYYKQNPVIKPEKAWENQRRGWFAAPFSGGSWYDPADKLFKIWYTGGFLATTCYATSKDGINWEKPELDVKRGTNVVLEPIHEGRRYFDSNTIWLDHETKNPEERFKYFATEKPGDWRLVYRTSADGIHWSDPKAKPKIWGDRTTAFYNPFRKVWVLSQRIEGHRYRVGRCRSYLEAPSAMDLMKEVTPNASRMISPTGEVIDPDLATENETETAYVEGKSVFWAHADDLDPRHTDPDYAHNAPQLYNLDAAPYESLMIGMFCIWQGPENHFCGELDLQKRNDVLLGFSRDGFHWDRPSRKRFFTSTWDEKNWRYGNVQSVAGGCLIVGDKLYFYFSGRAKPGKESKDWDADAATGLAMLRRDGFASMDAGEKTETLTTRPVTFKGKHLFVNVDCPKGELKAEVLDKDGKVIVPFDLKNCEPISEDKTLIKVNWQQNKDLADLAGKSVRFRFHLRNGSLYAFWVSPDISGASHGYVGAGGPGFSGPTDTVGKNAIEK